MGQSKFNHCLIGVTLALLAVSSLYADEVFVDPANFTGSRNSGSGGGITATGEWADGGFTLSWKIADGGDGTFEYEYEIQGLDREDLTPNLSYWIMQLTPIDADWAGVFEDVAFSTEVDVFAPEGGNPGMPGELFGVKFVDGTLEVKFVSPYAPVWGSFYATGGEEIYAYNTDFVLGMPDAGATDFTHWIPVDGHTVPEPSTLVLLLSGMGVLAGAARFRKKT